MVRYGALFFVRTKNAPYKHYNYNIFTPRFVYSRIAE